MRTSLRFIYPCFPYLLILCLGVAVSAEPEDVAIVTSVSGNVTVAAPSQTSGKSLRLFDWIPAGSAVRVPGGGRVTLAFHDGKRYELDADTEATLLPEGPKVTYGKARPLSSVSPMPRLASIAANTDAGFRSGAVRIRGEAPVPPCAQLYPCPESTALPDAASLFFAALQGVTRYRIVVMDADGHAAFEIETTSTKVAVPPGVLLPGAHYSWTAAAVEPDKKQAPRKSEFTTLTAESIQQRQVFRAHLETAGDFESVALLAEIDRRLGLLLEARDQFRIALGKSNRNPVLRQLVGDLDRRLPSSSK